MSDHEFSPDDLPRLRRGAYGFLRRYAASAWELRHDGDRWEITLPPDVAALPEHQRFRVHARQEARRLTGAQLYDLDPEITGRAVCLGAAICQGRHEEVVVLDGQPAVAATLEIQPPASSGFLRWRDGIGYNGLGAPVVACHWGPATGGGRWLAWWADSLATSGHRCHGSEDPMTSIGSPQTRGRASAGDGITCGAFDYGGGAAAFPMSKWPPWLTVSPVSDVRSAGEPARYPGTYELVIWRAQVGLARQFPDAAGWSGPGTARGRALPWRPGALVAACSARESAQQLASGDDPCQPGVGTAGAAGHQER